MIAQPAKFRLKHGHRCGLGLEGLVHEATASPDVGRAAVYLAEARSEALTVSANGSSLLWRNIVWEPRELPTFDVFMNQALRET